MDLKKPYHSRPHAGMVKLPPRVRVNDGDILLAVSHGLDSMAGGTIRQPRIWGDVIAQRMDGEPGFLYYNGARYAWYDPRTYKPDALARTAHGGTGETMR